jgi:hypothetical protein
MIYRFAINLYCFLLYYYCYSQLSYGQKNSDNFVHIHEVNVNSLPSLSVPIGSWSDTSLRAFLRERKCINISNLMSIGVCERYLKRVDFYTIITQHDLPTN